MTQEEKQYEDDDGRVICSMDVEGMPWHDKRARREQIAAALSNFVGDQMTLSETIRYTWHAVRAALLVVGVFSATMVLFVLFCIHVWFR